MRRKILVLGAGVIGLSTAIALLEETDKDYDVYIWTDCLSPHTVSDVAGAIWGPYHVEPEDLSNKWGLVARDRFIQMANDKSVRGVRLIKGYTFEKSEMNRVLPSWLVGSEKEFSYRDLPLTQFPEWHQRTFTHAYELTLPMIDGTYYMPYLERKYYELGGNRILIKKLESVDQITQFERDFQIKFDLVVNCTGFGSRKLFNDKNMVADQGQLVFLKLPSDTNEFGKDALQGLFYDEVLDPLKPTYILPRDDNIYVMGGVSKLLTDSEMESKPQIDAEDVKDILKRCDQLVPHAKILETGRVVEYKVGWRPYRKNGIRFELVTEQSRPIIHCYGFGGGGITLSWGAAQDVTKLTGEYFKSLSFQQSRL